MSSPVVLSLALLVVALLSCVEGVKIEVAKSSTVPPPVVTTIEVVTNPTTTETNNGTSTTVTSTTTAATTQVTTVAPKNETTTEKLTTTESPKLDSNDTNSQIGNPFLEFINRRAENKIANYYCHCDLIVNVCEVNCCCDLDCTKETFKYFDCAAGEKVDYREYDQLGPLQDCKISGGLLCVYKSNTKEVIKTFYDTSMEEKVKTNRWPQVFETAVTIEKRNEFYELGEELMIFNEASEMLETLTFARSFEGSSCVFNEPVTWLKPVTINCWRDADNASGYLINLFNKFNSSKVLIFPVTPSMEYHCSATSCANITIARCGAECQQMNSTNELSVSNHEIEVLIWHNYTHVSGMNITYIDTEVEFTSGGVVQQLVRVKWKAVDEQGFNSYQVSGNPGYLKEKPVLIAKEVTFSNYTDENKIYVLDFFYFHNRTEPYKANRTLLLPKSQRSKCVLDPSSLINFGVDVNRRCTAQLSPGPNLTNTVNFTSICETYQQQIFQLLVPNVFEDNGSIPSRIFISQLGNPRNDTRFWTKLDVKMENVAITGMWQPDSETFICSNMMISARFEFFYAKLHQPGANGVQNTIKKAVLYIEPRLDLQFKLHEMAVPIFIQTQFYDVTGGTNGGLRGVKLSLFSLIGVFGLILRRFI